MARLLIRPLLAATVFSVGLFLALVGGARASEPQATVPAVCASDFAIPNGWFYTQTGGAGVGFPVWDDADARFWTAFQNLGGLPVVGYPISQRFQQHGFTVQAFQKLVLQWDPAADRANAVNTLDNLHQAGFDSWLESFRQVPPHQALPADAGQTFDVVTANHVALLDGNLDIRAAFLAVPNWLTRFGLPIAYRDFGAVRVLRAQRVVLQQWATDTPWAKAGEVIFANSGDMAREAGLFPESAVTPGPPGAAQPTDLELTLDQRPAVQGATVLAELASGRPDVRLTLDGRALPLACAGSAWQTLVGLAADAEPGPRRLQVDVGGLTQMHEFQVAAGTFSSTELTVEPDLAHLLDPQMAAEERAFVRSLVDPVSGPPIWTGVFGIPASGSPTSPYGQRRVFHPGAIPYVHEGADVAAPLGALVVTPAAGRVAWAGPLAIRGNSVVLDHGFGVYSVVVHLDRIDVAAGATVTPGQALGTIGSTGRSTGPHLHWEVLVGGVAVDPTVWTWRDFVGIRNGTGYLLSGDSVEVPPGAPEAPTPPATPPDAGPTSAGETGQSPDDVPAG
ncbi:MAG: M23 family metallopeptidase [Chloroflexota bacterium]|nr:M23 family metallopeptidase [Chloroflexota bacterium]MDE2918471.1 M23 family metallopeptidase [Chloroflexota bacterium]